MRVLVCNLGDSASVNIRDRLLETGDWSDVGEFRGRVVRERGDARMVEVDGPTITDEALSGDLEAAGWPIEAVWFLSRHRAASGKPSLTVHPIGNHQAAEFGGRPETLSPSAPRDMGALLRRLRVYRDEHGLPHDVTYEATHHGPLMRQPSLFVEIGSNEQWYEDLPSGQALAAAVTDVLDGRGFVDAPVLVGAGGGHYVPRQTDLALAGEADFGHLVPAYAVDAECEAPDTLARALQQTPGATEVYVHKKGFKGPQRQRVAAWLEALGASAWSSG